MSIPAVPAFPLPNDPDFEAKADAFAASLNPFGTAANALAAAMDLNDTLDVSTSSVTIGSGTKNFVVSPNKSFLGGQYLTIADTAAPATNSMVVQVNSYNAGTGALQVVVVSFKGSGTKTAWLIALSAAINVSSAVAPVLAAGTISEARNLLGASIARRRNKWINGNIAIDTRNKGAIKTLTAGAAPIYTVDRIYAGCTGANATIQQTVNGLENRLLLTGGVGCTGMLIGTRIIAENTGGLGQCTQSVRISSGAITSVSWAAYAPSGGKNGFGSLASPTRTLLASGSFTIDTINAQEQRYSAQFSLGTKIFTGMGIEPSHLWNGVNVEFSVGAQANGNTISFGQCQLEGGSIANNDIVFEDVQIEEQVRDCSFYVREFNGADGLAMVGAGRQTTTTASRITIPLGESMFKAPTPSFGGSVVADIAGTNGAATLGTVYSSKNSVSFDISHPAVGAAGQGCMLQIPSGAGNYVRLEAEV